MSTETSADPLTGPAGPEVRGDRTSEFDPNAMLSSPAEYASLREECPVAWSSGPGAGYWRLTRYGDVAEAARTPKRFRSGQVFPLHPEWPEQVPLSLNPPVHTAYRRLLNRYFLPARMAELEPRIHEHVSARLTPLVEQGSGDMVRDYGEPVAAGVLTILLGIPDSFLEEITRKQWAWEAGELSQEEWDALFTTGFFEQSLELVRERRTHPLEPETDITSGLIAAEIDGAPLTDDAAANVLAMLFAAGHQTTARAMGSIIHALALDQELQERLRSDPALLPAALEEFMRLHPSVHEFARHAAEDVELHGRTLAEGELVGLCYAAANRDPAEFPDPDAFRLERSPNRHLSFGHGVHKCVGAPLARLDLRTSIGELLGRTARFELAGEPVPLSDPNGSGFSSLPVRLDPARP